jgi:hypothetical protein
LVGIVSRFTRLRNRLQAEGVDLLKDVNVVADVNVGGRHTAGRKLSQEELDRQESPAEGDAASPIDPIHPDSTGGTT